MMARTAKWTKVWRRMCLVVMAPFGLAIIVWFSLQEAWDVFRDAVADEWGR